MPKSITIKANDSGQYFLDIEVGGVKKTAKLDTGYTKANKDSEGGALTVNKANWDKIKDKLTNKGSGGESTTASGEKRPNEGGKGKIKIPGLDVEVEKFITFAGLRNDLLGTTFLHNLGALDVTLTFDLRAQTITFTVPDKPQPPKEGPKEVEEDIKTIEERNAAFDAERRVNRAFYERSSARLREQYAGQYVVIGNGELVGVRGTYDEAIAQATELRTALRHVLVFRADEDIPNVDELLGVADLMETTPEASTST
jgi:hypothetical protein